MTEQVNLQAYQSFVEEVTSPETNQLSEFSKRVDVLDETTEVNLPLLLNSALGLSAEAGEFTEIVKKCVFQGKPLDADTIFHAKRELGDVIWYWMNACRSLNLDPNDVIAENVTKLKKRYPGGAFDVYQSENREVNDI